MTNSIELFNKPIDQFSKDEREIARNLLNEADMTEMEKKVEAMQNVQRKMNEKVREIEKTQKNQSEDILQLKKETQVLGSSTHSSRRRKFRNASATRVKWLLGNDATTPEFILFSPYFYKGIYASIAFELDLDNWRDIPMEGYDEPGSKYECAKDIRDNWKPSRQYFKHCLGELIDKKDQGMLRKERCVALESFLSATENGTHVSFLK